METTFLTFHKSVMEIFCIVASYLLSNKLQIKLTYQTASIFLSRPHCSPASPKPTTTMNQSCSYNFHTHTYTDTAYKTDIYTHACVHHACTFMHLHRHIHFKDEEAYTISYRMSKKLPEGQRTSN